MAEDMKYSIIVLLDDIQPDFTAMVKSLYGLFKEKGETFEFVVVNNGVGSLAPDVLEHIMLDDKRLSYFEFFTKTTEAVCLKTALKESRGKFVIVYGSYQQINNTSLLELLVKIEGDADIISPWRQHRKDSKFNQIQSRAYNALVNSFVQTNIHDLGCKVKVFKREVLEDTDIYGDMYQYLPILAHMKGYKTEEVKCEHFKDHHKSGLYGLSMYLNRLVEVFTLYFNTRFTRKPLRFFSTAGVIFFVIGVIIAMTVFLQKIFMGYPIGDRPVLLLAILFSVVGVLVASVGLLGEIIAFVHGRHQKEYCIRKII